MNKEENRKIILQIAIDKEDGSLQTAYNPDTNDLEKIALITYLQMEIDNIRSNYFLQSTFLDELDYVDDEYENGEEEE